MEAQKKPYGIIKALGLVFGDIGTSPIYTVTVIFFLVSPTPENIVGIVSLILWTLMVLVTMEYAWLAMSLGKKGEGGVIVLREILHPMLKKGRSAAFVTLLAYIGLSLLIGDGIITPAISILSAVEGMKYIPGMEHITQDSIIVIAIVIATALFAFQRKGTEKVAGAFGPVMVVWFATLTLSGITAIMGAPSVLKAISPYYGIKFLLTHGWPGFFILSEVFLCATGGETLYADMGHLGRMPILKAWRFVFAALAVNYLGQGAFLMAHPEAKNILFEMVLNQARFLYVPFLVLSIMATVIASQAMISGTFSLIFQGINTHILPLFRVKYTSTDVRSQIYIGFANWALFLSVIFVMLQFRESHSLAAAYGLAVNGTMAISGIMMTWIFFITKSRLRMAAAVFVTIADIIFLLSNTVKIPHGGYWSLILASLPLMTILLYTRGQRRLHGSMKPMPMQEFLKIFNYRYKTEAKIAGSAIYFTRFSGSLPPYVYNTMFMNGIIYEDNILVSLERRDDPFGVTGFYKLDFAPGLRLFEIQYGYMEVLDIEDVLSENGIKEKTIFYGIEDVTSGNPVWRVFSLLKKVLPTFVQYHNLPSHKLHGVVTRVRM